MAVKAKLKQTTNKNDMKTRTTPEPTQTAKKSSRKSPLNLIITSQVKVSSPAMPETQARIRLTTQDRHEIWRLWQSGEWKVKDLAAHYHVSLPTIYTTLARARKQEFAPRRSVNSRFKAIKFGLKRLAKIEQELTELRQQDDLRCSTESGETSFDIKRLPFFFGPI